MKPNKAIILMSLMTITIFSTSLTLHAAETKNATQINSTQPNRTPKPTPLTDAIRNDDVKAVVGIIDKGLNIKSKDKNGKTLLMYALTYGSYEVIKELVARGADVNDQGDNGMTALMYAVEMKDKEFMNIIIYQPVNFKLKNSDNKTALDQAVKSENSEMIKTVQDAYNSSMKKFDEEFNNASKPKEQKK